MNSRDHAIGLMVDYCTVYFFLGGGRMFEADIFH